MQPMSDSDLKAVDGNSDESGDSLKPEARLSLSVCREARSLNRHFRSTETILATT